jgi:hypothetical protein
MTKRTYKSAMGKTVDLGALLLQNEQVRAVGNMNVNARGDLLDNQNRVIEPKNRLAQQHYRRQSTNVSTGPVTKSTHDAKHVAVPNTDQFSDMPEDEFDLGPLATPTTLELQPSTPPETTPARGGLAAAIARTREVKQELEKTRRQMEQAQGVKKI